MSIGYAGALIGGLLALLSPCSAMLLPAFFAYAFSTPTKLLARTGLFYLGLITTLIPVGILAGTVGSFLIENRTVLVIGAASIVIVLGLIQLVGLPLPALTRSGAGREHPLPQSSSWGRCMVSLACVPAPFSGQFSPSPQ